MEQNNQNSSGMLNGIPQIPKQDRKVGPIIGVLVVVLVLIITSLFFFGQKLNTTTAVAEQAVVATTTEVANTSTENTDSAAQIQADIDAQAKDIDYSF